MRWSCRIVGRRYDSNRLIFCWICTHAAVAMSMLSGHQSLFSQPATLPSQSNGAKMTNERGQISGREW